MTEPSEEAMQQIGSFDPYDAKRIIAELEKRNIPYEVESDDSALFTPNRWLSLELAMYPDGSKIVVFVPESKAPEAMAIFNELFSV